MVPSDFAELSVPVPSNLAELVGYQGEARWVALYWTPHGDESYYDDGQSSGTGSPWLYLAYVQHRAVAPHLVGLNLGSSDEEAEYALVVDRGENRIYVAPLRSAMRFLTAQHPPLPELTLEELAEVEASLQGLLDLGKWRETTIDMKAVQEAMECEEQQISELVEFLDKHV